MSEAAEQFLNVPDGNLAKWSAAQRTELAERNISIIVTGQKPSEGNPCVIVVDTGEGQKPEDFKDTLVSLLRSNKTSVPFVQGKFNMGSTGSLTYCSPNKNYQLIASRRNAAIPGIKNPKWGFTVVRKRPPLKNEKNERYEYLAPKGRVCELDLDEILIYPDDESTPYKRPTKYGTIVKLFEYDLPGSTKTMATVDFYRALSSKLWAVVEQFAEESESIELFEKLVAQNPALAEILGIGLKIKVPRPGDQPTPKFDGQRFPTFLKLEDAHENGDFVKKCPQNSYCRMILVTDAENDYLVRAFEPGKLIIRPEALIKCTSLYNGRLELQLAPDNTCDVGHRTEVKVMLTSPNSPEGYFSVRFWLEIDSPIQPKKHPPSPPKPPKVSTLALPEIKEIKKDGWSDSIEITSDEDVVTIMSNGDQSKTSLVNMDNLHYKRYVYGNPKREQEIRNIYKISSTIMGLRLLEQVDKGGLEEPKRRAVSNSLGRLLLPMVDSLGSKAAELERS